MLKQILESRTGPLTKSQFAEVMDLTATDIIVNRVGFGRLTNLDDVIQVAEITFDLLRRYQVA